MGLALHRLRPVVRDGAPGPPPRFAVYTRGIVASPSEPPSKPDAKLVSGKTVFVRFASFPSYAYP